MVVVGGDLIENYYDIHKKEKFEELYGETYIGKNPTKLRNSYHILRFNFSGIDTSTVESTINGFKEKVGISNYVLTWTYVPMNSISGFIEASNIEDYGLEFIAKSNDDSGVIISELIAREIAISSG